MSEEAKRWLEAGAELTRNPAAKVRCPACRGAMLEASDILAARGVERLMRCPGCGAQNWVLLPGPKGR